jgi:hypothetical protein
MIGTLIYLVIYLVVIGLIIWLLLYLIDVVPLPEPFNKVARVVIIVVGVIIVILLLLQLIEGGPGKLRIGGEHGTTRQYHTT